MRTSLSLRLCSPYTPDDVLLLLPLAAATRYERVPCLEGSHINSLDKPNPLGIRAVAGVFIMLGCGTLASILLLLSEHLFFKYALPRIRQRPQVSFWKSANLMLISQVSLACAVDQALG